MKCNFCNLLFCGAISLLSYNTLTAQNPVVKIDFDQVVRPVTEVNEPDYTPWIVNSVTSATTTINGITFTISKTGDKGDLIATKMTLHKI